MTDAFKMTANERKIYMLGYQYAQLALGRNLDHSMCDDLTDRELVSAYIASEEEAVEAIILQATASLNPIQKNKLGASIGSGWKPFQIRGHDALLFDRQRIDRQLVNMNGGGGQVGLTYSPIDEMNLLNYCEMLDIRARLISLFRENEAVDWDHLLGTMCDRFKIPFPHGVNAAEYAVRLAVSRGTAQFKFAVMTGQIEHLRPDGHPNIEELLMEMHDTICHADSPTDAATAATVVATKYNQGLNQLDEVEKWLEYLIEYVECSCGKNPTYELQTAQKIFDWMISGFPPTVQHDLGWEKADAASVVQQLRQYDNVEGLHSAMKRIKLINRQKPVKAKYLREEFSKLPTDSSGKKIVPLNRLVSNTLKIENRIGEVLALAGDIACNWRSQQVVTRLLDGRYNYFKVNESVDAVEYDRTELIKRDIGKVLEMKCDTIWQKQQAASHAEALLRIIEQMLRSLPDSQLSNYLTASLDDDRAALKSLKIEADAVGAYATFYPILMSSAYRRLKLPGSTLEALLRLIGQSADMQKYEALVKGWYARQAENGDIAYSV